ncbi:DsrE family protein [Pontibacter oryzae]|uniref:DoxX family membrane protein n=1 Tax=Pontibacter oryzae TaxID=2304593 RepID=A0A399RR67_9BACT|nr:DoxX family membrane protein [Pontibacter oryzae]RIJ34206.1 DoxX family membrane protein [Pontibacter oryzae]
MDTSFYQKLSFLVLRIMSSFIFIAAGFNHLVHTAGAAARLQQSELSQLATWMAPAETLVILSGTGLLLGGVALLLGFKTRLAALLLLAILVPITVTVQLTNPEGLGPMFKNIAIAGSLVFFSLNGALYFGLDQVLRQNSRQIVPMSKEKLGAVLALSLVGVFSSCATTSSATQALAAQSQALAAHKYAVLISQPSHLKAAVNTAGTITAESTYKRENFVIMACGKSVEAFVKGGDMAEAIDAGRKAGVTYRVCGMSMKKFELDKSMLVDGVEVVPNGLTHMFDLQLQGYHTVEL